MAHAAARGSLTAEDADEVVQEALLRAWRRKESCHAAERPDGWVVQIVRNETLRHIERRDRRATREVPDDSLDERAVADRRLDEAIDRAAFHSRIASLATADRRLLVLHYEYGLPVREIARRLRAPEGTIKVRLHRLRARLREVESP